MLTTLMIAFTMVVIGPLVLYAVSLRNPLDKVA